VGKTRSAYEAVKAVLPDWRLLHPAGPAEVAALLDRPMGRMVVWLDELQRYLGGQQGLTAGVMRALLNASAPVVIVATLWPHRYSTFTAPPTPDTDDRYAREREVLRLANVIRISPDLTEAEMARAKAAAAGDRRLQIALRAADYGMTQTLAAGPELVARWEDAKTAEPYAWAVLTAALDAARLGAQAPLSADLLRQAAEGYCTSEQQADAPNDWFERARDYATQKLHGATAPLRPAGKGMGKTAGYTAADYLLQHAISVRCTERIPAGAWNALCLHVQNVGDTVRLASSAACRLLYRYAIPLYCHAIDAGDKDAAYSLADLLVRCGDVDGLRSRADAGDSPASNRLNEILAERGDLDGLRARADAGDSRALNFLIKLMAERGDLEGLRARADAGDSTAANRLDGLLAERGDLQGLRTRADGGDPHALHLLVNLLTGHGEPGAAIEILRQFAQAGDGYAAIRLARILAEQGDLSELRARAKVGDIVATRLLARLLAERGELDEAIQILRAPADAGDVSATRRLDQLLGRRGDIDEVRERAKAGDKNAACVLADMLGQRGDLGELRARSKDGDRYAPYRLAAALAQRGGLGELRIRADAGDSAATDRLAKGLAERGDLAGLRTWADAGDSTAAHQLAKVLAERDDLNELGTRADAGDRAAAAQLADLLTKRGDLDGLRARAKAGDIPASWALVDLLIKSGAVDELITILRGLAPLHSDAAALLARCLAQRDDIHELRARTEAGDQYAAHALADVLARRGDLDELWARARSGDSHAAQLVADLLAQRSTANEAMRLRRFGLNADGSIASGPSSDGHTGTWTITSTP